MRRNRKSNVKKERIIMIASSAFVLSALTVTGIYMKSNKTEEQDDGYTLDFAALEESARDKAREIARNDKTQEEQAKDIAGLSGSPEDDLDYLPMEVGSGMVTIPGLTDGLLKGVPAGEGILPSEADWTAGDDAVAKGGDTPAQGTAVAAPAEEMAQVPVQAEGEADIPAQDVASDRGVAVEPLHFAEGEGLLWPVGGEVLIPFSMDGSVYFSTLDQFKYNPAMMIAAEQGAAVAACADGVVIDIFQDAEIGNAVTMDLGDGYQITYGQLCDIQVALGSRVEPGENFAFVAAPTKYYSVEGSNLYLKLTADGKPANPETLFR